MADTKITALSAITTVDPANDVLPIVDVSDTSMAASGTTKKITTNQILGASGTATLASATVTGNLTAAAVIPSGSTVPTNGLYLPTANNLGFAYNSTLGMTLNSTGLGVGVSPSYKLDIIGSLATRAATTGANQDVLSIRALNSDASAYANALYYANSQRWHYNGASLGMTLDSSGNLGIGVTPAGTGGCLQLKSGITFPATQVASSDANTLDDYEEGTFTPTLTFGGASVGVVYVNQIGIYTKVGRIVHFSGRIDLSSKGSSTGDALITGLPFVGNTGAASVGYQNLTAPSDKQLMLTIDGTALYPRYASGTTTVQSTNSDFGNSTIIIFAGTFAV